ncbi:MAG: DUF2007 domain-containing protein [Bacteroidales bacterium]|nr:DUF2007 domain-containing protein [Bacteroidales bacterium]
MIKTIYSSNRPLDCHIRKNRLETENIRCFIFDENMIYVHPFRAVAIGGAKLKVPVKDFERACDVLEKAEQYELITDEQISTAYNQAEEVLKLRHTLRTYPELMESPYGLKPEWIPAEEFLELINEEKWFREMSLKTFKFDWNQFWYELLDFDRDFLKYVRPKNNAYYLAKDEVDVFVKNKKESKPSRCRPCCPECGSCEIYKTFPPDNGWELPYFLLSIIFYAPFPVFFKKYRCLNCGFEFRKK